MFVNLLHVQKYMNKKDNIVNRLEDIISLKYLIYIYIIIMILFCMWIIGNKIICGLDDCFVDIICR